ncbi:MAG: gas vesicle protein GvpN, partial [Armatimonadetes bacterium]|nr:gas vesicle protein GvpN [Armatimonadota bacterium]
MATASRTLVDGTPVALSVHPRSDFVETPTVQAMTQRALAYLEAGFPVHFQGPAGTGKTTLALHVAAQL